MLDQPQTQDKLRHLKKEFGEFRIPAAKQELQGTGEAVKGELSIYSFSATPPDYFFQVKGKKISVRNLIGRFNEVVGGIKHEDIVGTIRPSNR